MFIDREQELEILEKIIKSKNAEFVIIYGRSRVGKTELLKQILMKRKNVIYILGRSEAPNDLLRRLSLIISDKFNDEWLARFPFRNLDEAFYYLKARKNVILILDEFPYMVSSEPKLLSILQDYWDNYLKTSDIKLFVCGSSIGMVERLLFDHNSPIYGRRTKQLKVEPLKFPAVRHFFPKANLDELVRIYSVLGGTPAYLLEYENNIFKTIELKILQKDQFLYKDAEFILRAELREPRFYFSIIRSIASGNTSLGNIMNDTGLSKDVASKYVATLCDLNIINKITPVTEKTKTRKGIYKIKDNYFGFYFRFIFPNLEYIETGESGYLMDKIKIDFPIYLGEIFEDIVLDFLREHPKILPFKPTRIGKWWYKEDEIDIVAINEHSNEILFCEIKYTKKKVSSKVVDILKNKANMVKWDNGRGKRKEYFMLISKSDSKKQIDNVIYFNTYDLFSKNNAIN